MTNLLLYQRIAQQLAEDIRRGVYQPGERVPSVRKMSSQLNVSHANYFIGETVCSLDSSNKTKMKDNSLGQGSLFSSEKTGDRPHLIK